MYQLYSQVKYKEAFNKACSLLVVIWNNQTQILSKDIYRQIALDTKNVTPYQFALKIRKISELGNTVSDSRLSASIYLQTGSRH